MNTIASRIIHVCEIKTKGNMSEFARMIEVSPAYISKLKNEPDRVPSERTLSDICETFSVDPVWLRTGVGDDPFLPVSREEQIADVLSKAISGASTSRDRLIRALARLPDDAFPLIEKFILDAAEQIEKEK